MEEVLQSCRGWILWKAEQDLSYCQTAESCLFQGKSTSQVTSKFQKPGNKNVHLKSNPSS